MTRNMEKYILFDNDGVIANTWDLFLRFQMQYLNKTRDEVLDVISGFCNKASFDKEKEKPGHNDFLINLYKAMYEFNGNSYVVPTFSKVTEIIKSAPSEIHMGIISTGSKPFIRATLRDILHKFDLIQALEDGLSKQEKAARQCKKWGVNPSEVKFVTDILADYWEMRSYLNPDNIHVVGWGKFQPVEEIAAVVPERQILRQFSDLQNLLYN